MWLRNGHNRRETESFLITVQNDGIRTNYIKARIDKTQQICKCRLRDNRKENINHTKSESCKLAQKIDKETGGFKNNWMSGDFPK